MLGKAKKIEFDINTLHHNQSVLNLTLKELQRQIKNNEKQIQKTASRKINI